MSFEGHPCFEIAAGSVQGRSHALAEKANQDAFVVRASGGGLVAVVADGCGSAERSEIGAWMGAHVVATELARAAERDLESPAFWDQALARVLRALRSAAEGMGGNLADTVHRFFLFTVVGVVFAGEHASVFSLGDGLWALNGEASRLGPFPGNAPPYLGHALLGEHAAAELRFCVHRTLPVQEVESVLIGTDGAAEWAELESRSLPGTREAVGPLAQLWQDDRFFEHPDALRRRLARMNRPFVRPVWEDRRLAKEPGLLEDDTTLVVVRARKRALRGVELEPVLSAR